MRLQEWNSLFVILLCANFTPCQSAAKLCVIPTEHSPCTCSVPCHTLEYYLSQRNSEIYTESNLTLEFLPGIHLVNLTFSSSNRTGFSLTGSNATIDLTNLTSSSWFTLYDSSNISFSNLDFLQERKCDLQTYILDFHNITDLLLSNLSLNNRCGGGIHLSNTQTGKTVIENVMFKVWYYALGMDDVNSIVDISHSCFYGSQKHLLLSAYYSMLTPNSALMMQYCNFNNGSGSISLYMLLDSSNNLMFNLSINHLTCTTPKGGDIYVNVLNYAGHSDDSSISVSINNAQLLHAFSSGLFLNFGSYSGRYNVRINECFISSHSEGPIRITLGSNTKSEVTIENSAIKNNLATPVHFPVSGMLIKGSIDPNQNPVTLIRNVSFESNSYVSSASIDSVVTVMLFFVHRVTISDCRFIDNMGTALYLENSKFDAIGTLTFANNTAHEGAAIYISGSSVINTNNETTIVFINNTAMHTGGAIYISSSGIDQILLTLNDGLLVGTKCFISASSRYKCMDRSCILQFQNNSAIDGGDAIYGGNLGQIYFTSDDETKPIRCIAAIKEMSILETTVSAVASSPSRVCLCEDHSAQCLRYNISIAIHPGQAFTLSVLTVGQQFGTSKGSVYAQILNKTSSASIPNGYKVQTVGIRNCSDNINILTYRITNLKVGRNEALVLTTEDVIVTEFIDNADVDKAIHTYETNNKSYVPPELLTLPVYVILEVLECPEGFIFNEPYGGCVCASLFSGHRGKFSITCDIDTQTIERQYSVWVDAENTTTRYSQHCPLLYCNTSVLNVNFHKDNGADEQCMHHHSGILCGRCQTNYSLAIGSSNCLPNCSNKYLSLLLVFAVAGVLLVLFIKFLNLTITQGMVNGLIFYANIVQSNKDTLLSSSEPAVRVFAAFIAWLNLDFGIETCFSSNLDIYLKTWLQFAFPLYLWVLAGGIILACRHSRLATKFFGNNAVQVLATIFLLSYNKILRIIITVCSMSIIHTQTSESGHVREDVVWTYDGNVPFFNLEHALLFAVCICVFLFLWLPFTLFILLGQWLQRYNHYWGLRWIGRVRPLLDAYYGPLKDHRHYWIGILLLARVVVIFPAADPLASNSANALTIMFLCISLLFVTIGLGGIYKQSHHTLMESALFANLASFAALSLYLDNTNGSQDIAVYIMVGLFSLACGIVVGVQIVKIIRNFIKRRHYTHVSVQESFTDKR